MSLQDIITSAGFSAQRLVYTGNKPKTYVTWQQVIAQPIIHADDGSSIDAMTYRVTLFTKLADYSSTADKLVNALKDAGYYICSRDAENYESDTGYYMMPITIQELKE